MFTNTSAAIIQFRGLTPYDRYPWFQVMRTYTQQWVHIAYGCGGTLTFSDVQIAENWLAQPIYQAGLEGKIVALYPFLGDINAGTCPLHDLRGRGPAANGGTTQFTNSTLGTTALGLVTSPTNEVQYLNTNLTPNAVAGAVDGATALPAGIGYYMRTATYTTTNPEGMGCYSNNQSSTIRCSIDLRSNQQGGSWCNSANRVVVASAAGANDYYLEASASNLRTLYKDGTSIGTNTTTDATVGSRLPIIIGGVKLLLSSVEQDLGYQSAGNRIGCAYLTLGTLGSTGAATLHTILSNFITVTGR